LPESKQPAKVRYLMLIAMAGLPGTGKTTLAEHLAAALGGVILSKDIVRAALFPPPVLDYSPVQDDVAMAAVFAATKLLLTTDSAQIIILDGRTFWRTTQVADLLALGRELAQEPFVVECVCTDLIASERLAREVAEGKHPAKNRNARLHAQMKATAETLLVPRLTLDTGRLAPDECLACALDYLRKA
jgi:predicted kinase